jgi:hypothetical protein
MPANPAPPDFSGALPDRPIGLTPPPTMRPLSVIGLFVLLFGLLGGVLWWLGPDLARDWRVGEVVEAEGARIEESRCRTWLVLFHLCDATIVDARGADPAKRTLRYFFIGRAQQGAIVPLRSKPAPEVVTSSLGLETFYQRLIALVLVVALLGLSIAACAQMEWQGVLTRRGLAGLSGQRLVPVIVTLEGKMPVGGGRRRWTYAYDLDGSRQQAFIELARGHDPLVVTSDGKQALALSAPSGGVPLLLDSRLSSLDLTDAEKEAFFAACRKALEEEPAA